MQLHVEVNDAKARWDWVVLSRGDQVVIGKGHRKTMAEAIQTSHKAAQRVANDILADVSASLASSKAAASRTGEGTMMDELRELLESMADELERQSAVAGEAADLIAGHRRMLLACEGPSAEETDGREVA